MNVNCHHAFAQTFPIKEGLIRCLACGYTKRIENPTLPHRKSDGKHFADRITRIHTGTGNQLCGEAWRLDQDKSCKRDLFDWEGYR